MQWLVDSGLAIGIMVDRLWTCWYTGWRRISLPRDYLMWFRCLKHELPYMHMFRIVHSAYSWAVEIYSIAGDKKKGKKKREEWGRRDDGIVLVYIFVSIPMMKKCSFEKLELWTSTWETMEWFSRVVLCNKTFYSYVWNESDSWVHVLNVKLVKFGFWMNVVCTLVNWSKWVLNLFR